MYCPSCGKQIADESVFCQHCGNRISAPVAVSVSSKKPVQWEYRDFTWNFTPGAIWCKVGSGAYSEAGARLEFWEAYQQYILPELQKWRDQGWQPVGEVGPASIQIRTYTGAKYGAIAWIFIFFISAMMLLLPLLFIWGQYAEPVQFRVQMRRPKK